MMFRVLKIIVWCLPIMLFIGLFWHYLTPSGTRVIAYEMGDVSPYVQRLLPDERVSSIATQAGDEYVTLLDEPVYFSVTPPPGDFQKVFVDVDFDPGGTPTLELGGLKDIAAQAFDFQPLANILLEDLAWTRHELHDGLVVFSKDPKSEVYKTILETPPDRSTVANYRATFPTPYREIRYTPLHGRKQFDVSLRGSHELLTYIKDEDFDMSIVYTDVNRTFGSDEGFVKVFDENGNLMTEKTLRDDGNIYDNQESSKNTVQVYGQSWPEGVYRIVLSGTSDIIWRSFDVAQRYLVVKNRVFIGDDVGYLANSKPTSLFTNAQRLTLETQHREGLQTVTVGGTSIVVDQVGSKYAREISKMGVNELRSPVGDVKVTGEGKYAFSQESFFDPDPIPLTAFTDLENSQINHVLATLAPVAYDGAWRTAGAKFAIDSLATENGAYKFALSAPGIHDNLGQVRIHSITVKFAKAPGTYISWAEFKHVIKLLLP